MSRSRKIFVAGHRGMVGGAIVRSLQSRGYDNVIVRTHSELPLDDRQKTNEFFQRERPDWVFLAAAKVGGIVANDTQSGDFIRDNLYIQTNVIDAAHRAGASKLLFLGSSCIYPKHAEQPLREDMLLTGKLEPTNSAYAIAKIAGWEMCNAYRKQFGFDAFTVMPSNIYGIGDNFHPENSHVAAGMMRRFVEAALSAAPKVEVWGTGAPLREFTFSEDLGNACVFLMESWTEGGLVNAGSGQEISIRDLAHLIGSLAGFRGEIVFDASKPDGTPRKIMDSGRLRAAGWKPATSIEDGMKAMLDAYRATLDGAGV